MTEQETKTLAPAIQGKKNTLAFFAAVLIIGMFLPWADFKAVTYSGFEILTKFDSLNQNLQRSFFGPGIMALPLVSALLLGLGFVIDLKVDFSQNENKILLLAAKLIPWAAAFLLTLFGLVVALNSASDKVKHVQFIIGLYYMVAAAAAYYLTLAYWLWMQDQENGVALRGQVTSMAAAFLLLFGVALLFNYNFVNYKLIEKGSEFIKKR